jgi:hypothetical protein
MAIGLAAACLVFLLFEAVLHGSPVFPLLKVASG